MLLGLCPKERERRKEGRKEGREGSIEQRERK